MNVIKLYQVANNPQITIQVILDNYQVLFVIINQPTT